MPCELIKAAGTVKTLPPGMPPQLRHGIQNVAMVFLTAGRWDQSTEDSPNFTFVRMIVSI